MPFPSTWSEELAAEYLQLEGYIVVTGYPVQIGKRGGRKDIDVLGFKVENGKLKILQLEIGQLYIGGEKVIEKIKEKFSASIKKEIDRIAKTVFKGLKYEWIKECVLLSPPPKQKRKLEREKIELLSFNEFYKRVEEAVKNWREKNKTKKGTPPTLPSNLWLLKLIENRIAEEKKRKARGRSARPL
jgi:hypothetical protein